MSPPSHFCSEHSGQKVMLFTILFAVLGTLTLQMYNSFVQVKNLELAMSDMNGRIALIEVTVRQHSEEIAQLKKETKP